jgi:hypothetical protein
MNRVALSLLKRYLARNVWLYAFLAVVQFLMVCGFWTGRYDRVPLAGALLGFWGAVAAVNKQSLVWRSLPLRAQDVSLFRWWAIAGVPGIVITLLILIAWAAQRSGRFPPPAAETVLEAILAAWSVLGVLATLSRVAGWFTRKFRTARIIAASAICAAPLLACGVPVGPSSRPYSTVFICVGVILLLVCAERARRGLDWRWPDLVDNSSGPALIRAAPWLTHRYGMSAILIPVAQRAAIFAVIATAIIVLLQRLFPRASDVLFGGYFIALLTVGFVLTYRVRMALQALRCLPLSAKQLAGLLQLYGALPGVVTLGLTLLTNGLFLHAQPDMGKLLTLAFGTITFQIFPVSQTTRPGRSKSFRYWLPLIQRLYFPIYMVLFSGAWIIAYDRFPWMLWSARAALLALFIAGYFILVQQLRSGIRPSSNENAFSPG